MIDSYTIIKVPGTRIQQLPVVMLEDKIDIKEIAVKHSFDHIVVPSVQSGREIQELRLMMGPEAMQIQILARIDTVEGVSNF